MIGLCIALTNHVLFVLPIAETLFGEKYARPIISIITMDGLLLFAGTIILLDFLETQDLSITDTFRKIILNPPLIAVLIGLVFGLSKSQIPVGIEVFLNAVAVSSSLVLLWSLCIILCRPYKGANLTLPFTITFINLVLCECAKSNLQFNDRITVVGYSVVRIVVPFVLHSVCSNIEFAN